MSLKRELKKSLRTKPRKFQAQGILFLERNNGRAIIGDDMGLGKTLQVIGWLALRTDARPAVIACPANAKYEWEEQIKQHTRHMRCQVLSGRKPYEIEEDIIIVNYDIIPFWTNALLALKPRVLAMDECHYLKTRKIKRTEACKKISRVAEHVIPMSGTPILNRPVEFFPVLNMIYPRHFKSFWKYAFRYCNPKKGFQGRGWQFNGAMNTEELHEIVAPFMIRRMKTEVLTELPQKQRIRISVDLSNRRQYDTAANDFLNWYQSQFGLARKKKAARAVGFVKVGQLKRLAAEGKMNAALQWIDDFLETTDEKLVVFVHHRHIFEKLAKRYSRISAKGGKAGRYRKIEVARFQKDKRCRLFIASLSADKEAITLTAASKVLFLEQGWTPGEHDQAEDRVNRIGQTSNSIVAYYMLAHNTIDDHIWALIQKKRQVVAQILDGQDAAEELAKRIPISRLLKQINQEQ